MIGRPPDPEAERRAPAGEPTPHRHQVETPTTDTNDRAHGSAAGAFQRQATWARATRRRTVEAALVRCWLEHMRGAA